MSDFAGPVAKNAELLRHVYAKVGEANFLSAATESLRSRGLGTAGEFF